MAQKLLESPRGAAEGQVDPPQWGAPLSALHWLSRSEDHVAWREMETQLDRRVLCSFPDGHSETPQTSLLRRCRAIGVLSDIFLNHHLQVLSFMNYPRVLYLILLLVISFYDIAGFFVNIHR